MKKTLVLILALVMVSMLIPCTASAESYKATLPESTKTNVLSGVLEMLTSPAGEFVVGSGKTTDGEISISGGKPYINAKWHSSIKDATEQLATGGTIEMTMTDKTTKKYYYTITYSDLKCNVDSFALYFSNENAYSDGSANSASYWQIDAQWAILVSCDNGNTWTEAYVTPTPTTTVNADNLRFPVMGAASTEAEGGIFTEVTSTDPVTNSVLWYRYVQADLDKRYEGVTDIAYACVQPRWNCSAAKGIYDADGNAAETSAHYYMSRITELAVYGDTTAAVVTTEEATTAEVTTAEVTTEAATEDTTEAPVETTAAAEITTSAAAETTQATEKTSGCGSAMGICALVALLPAALVIRKKH